MRTFKQRMSPIAIIVAVDQVGGFGKGGKIPWHYSEDFKQFQQKTKGHVCVMGRKTYEDMLEMRKARLKDGDVITEILPERESFVITSDKDYVCEGATPVQSLRQAVQSLEEDDQRVIFVLGGEKMFIEALSWADTIYMTVIDKNFECDRFFPIAALNKGWTIVDGTQSDDNPELHFLTYTRK